MLVCVIFIVEQVHQVVSKLKVFMFVVSDKVYWSTFLNKGFPCTNQNISFLKFIDKNMQAWIVCKVDTPSDCAGLGQIMPLSQLFTT